MRVDNSIRWLQRAAESASKRIRARPRDGSFLESTLRDELAADLHGSAIEVKTPLLGWPGNLGGFDICVMHPDIPYAVETKVWDVGDSLYDLLKLASAVSQSKFAVGYLVIAGRSKDWQTPTAIRQLSERNDFDPVDIRQLLIDHETAWTKVWAKSRARPTFVPDSARINAGKPVPMPAVADHEIRIIQVVEVSAQQMVLNDAGQPEPPTGR